MIVADPTTAFRVHRKLFVCLCAAVCSPTTNPTPSTNVILRDYDEGVQTSTEVDTGNHRAKMYHFWWTGTCEKQDGK